ncbi:MAG: PKD domain-containing protein [Acidobacteriota bacterium]|nr:PKD domain-containing protein [Acidobacteriota bacterium]
MLRNSRGTLVIFVCAAFLLLAAAPAAAQSDTALERIEARANNKPLASLAAAAAQARARGPKAGPPREAVNFRGEGRPLFGGSGSSAPDAVLQTTPGEGATVIGSGFPGATNNDNGLIVGFLIAPPDTDGSVGPDHFVQMINLLTTIYDKNGDIVVGGESFESNAFWEDFGGNCEPYNQGDPIVLYDEFDDRWLVSQFAFPDSMGTFSQCVAISKTGDPTGGWHRYEFSFDSIGFNDYPKHGIVSDSITMTANLFTKRGRSFSFGGTFLGVMDKAAMYAGQPASLIGFNIGGGEFGFVAGDLDGLGSAPALFATAMSTANVFDIWQMDVDWGTGDASVNKIASIGITPFDADLCLASREACIPQPDGGPALEAMSDRLMHRLQLRDFGGYSTMVSAHAIDVGGGRAGIRWYEMRESVAGWSLYQEGTFGPDDDEHRWMPSAAMNAAGDIGIGYLVASTDTYVSTRVTGQSAANSGSGFLDAEESICAVGSGVQEGTGRSGDYSSTSVDPTLDTFWHTNEVFIDTGNFQWATFVCEFSVGSGGSVNQPPTAAFTYGCDKLQCTFTDTSTDSDGTVIAWNWDFGDSNTSTSQNPSHTYGSADTYTVTLTVTDNEGATGNTSQSVTVSAANIPPTAAFTFSCTDLGCSFDGNGSSDSDGTIASYDWDFGDGATDSGVTTSHPYAAGDTYNVTLTVTDDGGATGSETRPVTVTEPSSGITLTASGRKVRGVRYVDLAWSGATTDNVDIYRNGEFVASTDNGGAYTDNLGRVSGTYVYKVCEEGSTSTCSNEATWTF